jgi:hypothetical protein
MTVLIIIGSVLLGAILGRFFKVLVLLPAFALSLAIVVASSAYFGHSLSRTFIELVALVVSLQLGYVSGLLSSFIRNLRPGLEPSLYPDLDHLRQGDSLTEIFLEQRRSSKRVPIKRAPIKQVPTSGRKRPNTFASLPCNRLTPTTAPKPVCTRVNSPRIISGSRLGGSRPAAKVNVTHSKTKRTVPQAAVRCDKRPGLRHCGLQRAGGCSRMR